MRWVAENLPVYAINLILTTPTELWALRYPDTHDLFLLRRGPGGPHGDRRLDHASTAGAYPGPFRRPGRVAGGGGGQ